MIKFLKYLLPILFIFSFVYFNESSRSALKKTYQAIDGRNGLIYSRKYGRETINEELFESNPSDYLIFMTYGQSNAANASNFKYVTKNNVYEYWDGVVYEYKEPSLGASGNGGSVWGMVGDKLIESNVVSKVIFLNAAQAGASMEELAFEEYGFIDNLILNYKRIYEQFGKIDGILIHQGESNIGNTKTYEQAFKHLQKKIEEVTPTTIFLSKASYCGGISDKNVTNLQQKIIDTNKKVIAGPSTDSMEKGLRYDDCHFNETGLQELSDSWSNLILAHIRDKSNNEI